MQGTDGDLYGTTTGPIAGVGSSLGTIFKLTPSGTLSVLHTFSGPDGAYPADDAPPAGPLLQAADGNLYGTTQQGGASYTSTSTGFGTIFKMTTDGMLTTVHSFTASDGAYPGSLIQGADGNLYGTTQYGGAGNCPQGGTFPDGCGTIFRITPAGSFTELYSFNANEGSPTSPLIPGADGNFYGTTGIGALGIFFKITPAGSLTTILNFDVNNQVKLDFLASDGNFYGIAVGDLSLIRMTPGGVETTVYTFCTQGSFCAEGENPTFLIFGSDGSLYGTTNYGGANLYGAVYRLILPATNLPSIASNAGVVNGASFQPGIVPGSWMTVKGNNLSSISDAWNVPPNGALPTTLDGVSLMVGNQPA
jgi:uncharacterized repeat protein (TIGR03803 family)